MSLAADLLLVSSLPIAAASAYLATLALLSRRAPPPEAVPPELRFAIVVPAHDEEVGIVATVHSLSAVDYPPALRRVVVVADNCGDATAERAEAAGALVYVRDDPERRGKGYALAHAFERCLAEGWADAVVVVDADTVVTPNLLHVLSARLARGAEVLQVSYVVQNPEASWRTRLMAIAFASVHRLRSLARERLELSSGLRGNGMCFATSVLRAVPYGAFSVVEDLEHGIRLGEAGYRVHYVDEAEVRGEMPASEEASRSQRRRWEGGRARMVRLHLSRLLVRAVRARDLVALDLAVELLIPPLATLLALSALGLVASFALSWHEGAWVAASWLWAACALGLGAYGLRGWALSGTGLRGLASVVHIPGYVAWKLLLLVRRSAHASGEWVRTPRRGERPS
jgi:1,2-diacylglycerol 3-beta-glucosyltransferase